MTIGERIKKARKDAKLTQKDLGEKIGVSGSMIGQWENDLRCPKMETLQKIASALDVNITNLSSDINTLFHQITDAILESEPEIAKEFERIDRQTEHKFNLLKMFEVCLNTYSWKIRVEEDVYKRQDLQKKDVDIRMAQYLMGHADIKLTANIYTHTDTEMIVKVAEKII